MPRRKNAKLQTGSVRFENSFLFHISSYAWLLMELKLMVIMETGRFDPWLGLFLLI
jgi:hypothetical protein